MLLNECSTKFRTMIKGLNEKYKSVQASMINYATLNDIENLNKIISAREGLEQASAIKKKTATCLFCGKSRNSVVGQLSSEQAASSVSGSQTVQNVIGGSILYGDGGAFRADENISRIPLPNLKTQ